MSKKNQKAKLPTIKMRELLIILSLGFNLNLFGQVNGKFCCDNNWDRIEFKSDSVVIIKPFYYGGHFGAVGKGTYWLDNDTLYIVYSHESKTDFRTLSDGKYHKDSIDLYFSGAMPIRISYANLSDTIYDIGMSMKKTIVRRNDSLYIESFFSNQIIPNDIINDTDITGLEIYLDEQSYILERFDTFGLKIISETEIMLEGKKLNKNNCDKKPSPIY
jgi:hypothetical protein